MTDDEKLELAIYRILASRATKAKVAELLKLLKQQPKPNSK
jgi:hypothetical protein